MSTKITSARLEMVRLTREHCYGVLDANHAFSVSFADMRPVAEALLDTGVETLASWVQLDETVLANIRLLIQMANTTMIETDRDPQCVEADW